FNVVESLKHGWKTVPELRVHLVDGALHEIANQQDVGFVVEDRAVAGNDRVGVELSQVLQCLRPLARIAVVGIWQRERHEIACNYDFFFGKIDNGVAARVAASQEFDLNFAIAEVDSEVVIEGQRCALELDLLQLFSEGNVPGEDGLDLAFFVFGDATDFDV